MGFFKFFDPEPVAPNEWRVIKHQYVLISEGSGWHQRVLHKDNEGGLWVHGFAEFEWLELSPDGTVKEAPDGGKKRVWRDMPTMLDQPFITIREGA